MSNDKAVPTASVGAGQDAASDVVSDPAKDDTEGQDWSDEGGATVSGAATNDDQPPS